MTAPSVHTRQGLHAGSGHSSRHTAPANPAHSGLTPVSAPRRALSALGATPLTGLYWEREVEIVRQSQEVHPTGQAKSRGGDFDYSPARTSSRDIYAAERDASGQRSYFRDLWASQTQGDVNASERIRAFTAEERAVSSTGFAGLVVPQYLVDQAALVARASRPVANSVQKLELPSEGMVLQVPKGTGGAAVAPQAIENTAVQNTDESWSLLTLPVATIAGQQDVSRQSLERGTPGLDGLIMADLSGAYSAALEGQVISGTGASGQVLGILNTAGINQASGFTAAATVSTFLTKVAGQVAAITSTRYLPPDCVAMSSRRWSWLLAQTDTTGRPLVTPTPNANNALALGDAAQGYGETGYSFLGLRVIVSGLIPTAVGSGPEDQVIVYRSQDLLLFEDDARSPGSLRFEQTLGQQLTVKLVAYGYVGFTAGRYPTAVGVVGGNSAAGFGLTNPQF